MTLSNENYEIQISKDKQYTLYSTDNKFYDQVFDMEKYSRNDFISAYCISVNDLITEYKIVLIGSGYGCIEDCAILEKDSLVILIGDYLVKFNLVTRNLDLKIKVINFGTGIELYAFDDGYIVNGEIDIIKVDKSGNKIWSFRGEDVWKTTNGESSINIKEDTLVLIDFEGNKYYLDKLGQEMPM